MEQKNRFGLLLLSFITLIVGINLLSSTADSIYLATTLSGVGNETITIASGAGTTANDDVTSLLYFGNTTISTATTGIDIGDEVNFTKAGTISVSQINFSVDTNYDIAYDYEGDEYVAHSTARTLIILIKLFFALAVLLVGVGSAYAAIKDLF